ncbi:MAG: MarR family transcriptional regulator [Eubacteriales bacterium]
MLEERFLEVYTRFKLEFYRKIFARLGAGEGGLSTVEAFCVETIYALNKPTVQQFSTFLQISSPNAAYKVNSLIKKGYLQKVQSLEDKREFHLEVTQKYIEEHGMSYDYMKVIIDRVTKQFPEEDIEVLERILTVMSSELMEEFALPTPDKVLEKSP